MNSWTSTAIFVMLSGSAIAQNKTPVFLSTSINASLGSQYTYELKEAIRSSHTFRLVDTEDELTFIRFGVVGVEGLRKDFLALSTVFTYDAIDIPVGGALIIQHVEICPAAKIGECIRGAMGALDAAASRLQKRNPRQWKILHQQVIK